METSEFPLHQSVFDGDIQNVSKLIRTCDVSQRDIHGNNDLNMNKSSLPYHVFLLSLREATPLMTQQLGTSGNENISEPRGLRP